MQKTPFSLLKKPSSLVIVSDMGRSLFHPSWASRRSRAYSVGASGENRLADYLPEVLMRKLLVVGVSAVSASLFLYTNSANALPVATKSLAASVSIGEDLFQQVHFRRYRHRHPAYRGYRGYPIGTYPYTAYSYPVYVPFYFGHHLGGHHFGGHHFGGHLGHHGYH